MQFSDNYEIRFDNVMQYYQVDSDLECNFTLNNSIKPDCSSRIGLFRESVNMQT